MIIIADDGTRTRKPLDYKLSALAIELYSSKAVAGKELSQSIWCIVYCVYKIIMIIIV